ncbi:MAG: DoxX family protein [Brevinematia bacterium]
MVDLGVFILRVLSGGMLLIFHTLGKVTGFYSFLNNGNWKFVNTLSSVGFPLPVLFAIIFVIVEFFATIFVIVGFFTRISAGLLTFLMLIFVYFHPKFGISFELGLLYLSIFLVLLLIGGGKYSVDAYLRRK